MKGHQLYRGDGGLYLEWPGLMSMEHHSITCLSIKPREMYLLTKVSRNSIQRSEDCTIPRLWMYVMAILSGLSKFSSSGEDHIHISWGTIWRVCYNDERSVQLWNILQQCRYQCLHGLHKDLFFERICCILKQGTIARHHGHDTNPLVFGIWCS